jgi:hypothetical protein
MDVIIEKQETIIALRQSKYIRYVEPADYSYLNVRNAESRSGSPSNSTNSSSSSGCGYESQTLAAADFTTTTPNAKVPWTFTQHKIPNAWNVSTGRGITIGIIDTGVSPNQSLLGANFNNGLSTGRTIQKNGVYINSEMVKVDPKFLEFLEKLQTYYEKFKSKWSKVLANRKRTIN